MYMKERISSCNSIPPSGEYWQVDWSYCDPTKTKIDGDILATEMLRLQREGIIEIVCNEQEPVCPQGTRCLNETCKNNPESDTLKP
jgi:hypothetical protein